jgi:hypothetical protein
MKKLITNLFLGLAIMASFQANAQYCGSSQVSWPSCGVQNNYGFGDYNTFPCITRGQNDSLIIPFKMYQTFTAQGNTITIVKLQFNTIDSLPCGLCWSTSKSINPNNMANEFDPNESGCIKIAGLTNDQAGSYLLSITLNVASTASTTPGDTTFFVNGINSQAGNIAIWIKVIDSTTQCPDTVDQTLLRHPSTSCANGIREVSKTLSNLSIQPNPLTNEAKVSFSSEVAGNQQIIITDAIGREVYSNSIMVKQGTNETTIKRNNLSAGIYILSIGSSQGTATSKFVIED